jgi:hypothetical protein
MPQKTAVATSLAAIILTALLASAKESRKPAHRLARRHPCGLAGRSSPGLPQTHLKHLSNPVLTRLFAVC